MNYVGKCMEKWSTDGWGKVGKMGNCSFRADMFYFMCVSIENRTFTNEGDEILWFLNEMGDFYYIFCCHLVTEEI